MRRPSQHVVRTLPDKAGNAKRGSGCDPHMTHSCYAGPRSDKPRFGEALVDPGMCPKKSDHIDKYLAAKAARKERDGKND